MAKFMFVFRGGGIATPGLSPTELQEHLAKWTAWHKELTKQGRIHVGGHPLQGAAKVVRGREKRVTDGPFAESKDMLTGTMLIEATSLDDATKVALDCPVYLFDGSVEVRPILEMH